MHLRAFEADAWRSVVSSLPADYFRVADQLLLSAWCQQWFCYQDAMEQMGKADVSHMGAHHRIATKALRNALALSTKLRLTPQSDMTHVRRNSSPEADCEAMGGDLSNAAAVAFVNGI